MTPNNIVAEFKTTGIMFYNPDIQSDYKITCGVQSPLARKVLDGTSSNLTGVHIGPWDFDFLKKIILAPKVVARGNFGAANVP